jgi:predicted ATPase
MNTSNSNIIKAYALIGVSLSLGLIALALQSAGY